jgi:hypothetical protein
MTQINMIKKDKKIILNLNKSALSAFRFIQCHQRSFLFNVISVPSYSVSSAF